MIMSDVLVVSMPAMKRSTTAFTTVARPILPLKQEPESDDFYNISPAFEGIRNICT
jgi:hypothetical protein